MGLNWKPSYDGNFKWNLIKIWGNIILHKHPDYLVPEWGVRVPIEPVLILPRIIIWIKLNNIRCNYTINYIIEIVVNVVINVTIKEG